MTCGLDLAKAHARVMHRRASEGDAATLADLAKLEGLRDVALSALPALVQRKQCLALVARKLGLGGWANASRVLDGELTEDFGDLLYPGTDAGMWNVWSAQLEEARTIRAEHGGYLLAYRKQFVIAEASFIERLGLDPRHADWECIERDWLHEEGGEVRKRFYETLVAQALGVAV